jgi:Swiss Army Knife, 2H phosphoesterase domain
VVPETTLLHYPKLIQSAKLLLAKGKLAIFDQFVYAQVSDNYVHQLYALLEDKHIIKPDYFGEQYIGAHITVIYPEEYVKFDEKDLGQEHNFLIKELIAAKINQKIYYALLVESVSLMQIRKKYDLPDLLCFKGYQIGFHITIGVKRLDLL